MNQNHLNLYGLLILQKQTYDTDVACYVSSDFIICVWLRHETQPTLCLRPLRTLRETKKSF
jgi:hypothetical protein